MSLKITALDTVSDDLPPPTRLGWGGNNAITQKRPFLRAFFILVYSPAGGQFGWHGMGQEECEESLITSWQLPRQIPPATASDETIPDAGVLDGRVYSWVIRL